MAGPTILGTKPGVRGMVRESSVSGAAEAVHETANYHLWLIGGPPNVGKTTLVSSLVDMLNYQFPDSADFVLKATTRPLRGAEDRGLEFVSINEFLDLSRRRAFFYEGFFGDTRYGVRKTEIFPLDRDRFLITAKDVAFPELLDSTREEGIPTVPILLVTATETLEGRAIQERPPGENAVRLPMLGKLVRSFDANTHLAKYVVDTTSLGDLLKRTSSEPSQTLQRKLAYGSMMAKINQLAAIVNLERRYGGVREQETSPARLIHTYFDDCFKDLFGKSIAEVISEGKATFRANSAPLKELESKYIAPFLATRIFGFTTHKVGVEEETICLDYSFTTSSLSAFRRDMVNYDRVTERDAVFAMFQKALNHEGYRTGRDSILFWLTDAQPRGHEELARVSHPIYRLEVSFENGTGTYVLPIRDARQRKLNF